jgi:hypothetical protein
MQTNPETKGQRKLKKVMNAFNDPYSTDEDKEEALNDFFELNTLVFEKKKNKKKVNEISLKCLSVFKQYKNDKRLKQMLESLIDPKSSSEEIKETINNLNFLYPQILNCTLCLYFSKGKDEPNGVLYKMARDLELLRN